MKFGPEIPGVTRMQDSNTSEIIHLFEVMKKHKAKCGLEFQSDGASDPLIGVSYLPIELIEYCEHSGGPDSVIIELGEMSFNFELGSNKFTKDITDCQITVCISSDKYTVWFNSDVIPPEGIAEALNYDGRDTEFDDKEIILDANSEDQRDFEDGVESVKNLLLEGRVIKKTVVNGGGKQVLTVGFFTQVESNES